MILRIDPLEELMDLLFYNFPVEPKPPIALSSHGYNLTKSYEKPKDISINMALAGFKEDDISVYIDENILYIEGDNTYRDSVPEKFKSKFKRSFPVKGTVDLNKACVKLSEGILSVTIPLVEPEDKKQYIFGNPDKKE